MKPRKENLLFVYLTLLFVLLIGLIMVWIVALFIK